MKYKILYYVRDMYLFTWITFHVSLDIDESTRCHRADHIEKQGDRDDAQEINAF